jgi:hypothetical protein
MSDTRPRYADLTLDELAETMASMTPGAASHGAVMAEVIRRQTLAQINAAEAQKRAADATERTAEATKKSSFYMLVYVCISAVALIASIIVPLVVHYH